MRKLPQYKINEIISLRTRGYSIPDISQKTGVAKTTIQRYVLGTEIPALYLQSLKERQGGSKVRALGMRENVSIEATDKLGTLTGRDYLLLLVGLYWGEGTKRDFCIVNSDPFLIQTVILCLLEMGIPKHRLNIALRIHSTVSIARAKVFWTNATTISMKDIQYIEVIEGKKKGKLPYGMCRVRVRNGIRERVFIQSLISLIGKDSENKLVSA